MFGCLLCSDKILHQTAGNVRLDENIVLYAVSMESVSTFVPGTVGAFMLRHRGVICWSAFVCSHCMESCWAVLLQVSLEHTWRQAHAVTRHQALPFTPQDRSTERRTCFFYSRSAYFINAKLSSAWNDHIYSLLSFLLTGAPVVASFPHFYLAEDKYVAAIEGMSPSRIHHQTFLDLNPVSHSPQFTSHKSTTYSAAMIVIV